MNSKRIKIFLGGFINYTNAQNLNCLALSKYLDKDKFQVYTLSMSYKTIIDTDVIIFNCFFPFSISSFIGYVWGIFKCDVAYLPKHLSTSRWIFILAKFLNKKIFTTIEMNMCDQDKESVLNAFGSYERFKNHFKYFDNIFGITSYIINNAVCGVKLNKNVLYLGVETNIFNFKLKKKLQNIVFIGSLTKRKKVEEILSLAKKFSMLNFYIIGGGNEEEYLRSLATENVFFLGKINQKKLSIELDKIDLHILPSRSEGFPKVILETASAGIPSLVYSDYGASEWINHGENGFIVDNFNQMCNLLSLLLEDDMLLDFNSKGAYNMSRIFDWKIVVKEWEKNILDLI